MEALLLLTLLPFIVMLNLTDGSSLTRDIELIFYYTDNIVQETNEEPSIAKTQVKHESSVNPKIPAQEYPKQEVGANPPQISSNIIDSIKGKSDNLGKDPHNIYRY